MKHILFEVRARLEGVDPIGIALDWLVRYVTRSSDMPLSELKSSYVVPLLRPLIRHVPYVPTKQPLFRLFGTELHLRKNPVLDAGRCTSFTTETRSRALGIIADTVGLFNENHCYLCKPLTPVMQISNSEWLHKQVVPWATKWAKQDQRLRLVREPFQILSDFRFQKEVIAFSPKPIQFEILRELPSPY